MAIRGQGRRATSLGVADPRARRAGGALSVVESTVAAPIIVDASGRITLDMAAAVPAAAVASPTNTAALTDSTTGTASATLGVTADAATNDNFASVAATLADQRALNSVLMAAVLELIARHNQMVTSLRDAGIMAR